MKHVLLKNENDRWLLCWKYLNNKLDINWEAWKKEDRPLLEPYFKWNKRIGGNSVDNPMTEEERKSFDHYIKCYNEYAQDLFAIRDMTKHYGYDDILNAFGYEHEEELFEDDTECYVKNPLTETSKPNKDLLNLEYPVVAVVWIESDYNRGMKDGIMCVDFVELKEFKE